MEGELPVTIEIGDHATADVVARSGEAERVTVTITSGRGEVTLQGPVLGLARLIVEVDRQLSHLLAVERRRQVG